MDVTLTEGHIEAAFLSPHPLPFSLQLRSEVACYPARGVSEMSLGLRTQDVGRVERLWVLLLLNKFKPLAMVVVSIVITASPSSSSSAFASFPASINLLKIPSSL